GVLTMLAVGCSSLDWMAPVTALRDISGQVVDAATGTPIGDAFVVVHVFSTSLRDASVHQTRDAMWGRTRPDGRFFIHGVVNRLFPFNIRWQTQLKVVAPGYQPTRAEVSSPVAHIAVVKTPPFPCPTDYPGLLNLHHRLRAQCDWLFPASQACSLCEQLMATVCTAADPKSASTSG